MVYHFWVITVRAWRLSRSRDLSQTRARHSATDNTNLHIMPWASLFIHLSWNYEVVDLFFFFTFFFQKKKWFKSKWPCYFSHDEPLNIYRNFLRSLLFPTFLWEVFADPNARFLSIRKVYEGHILLAIKSGSAQKRNGISHMDVRRFPRRRVASEQNYSVKGGIFL